MHQRFAVFVKKVGDGPVWHTLIHDSSHHLKAHEPKTPRRIGARTKPAGLIAVVGGLDIDSGRIPRASRVSSNAVMEADDRILQMDDRPSSEPIRFKKSSQPFEYGLGSH